MFGRYFCSVESCSAVKYQVIWKKSTLAESSDMLSPANPRRLLSTALKGFLTLLLLFPQLSPRNLYCVALGCRLWSIVHPSSASIHPSIHPTLCQVLGTQRWTRLIFLPSWTHGQAGKEYMERIGCSSEVRARMTGWCVEFRLTRGHDGEPREGRLDGEPWEGRLDGEPREGRLELSPQVDRSLLSRWGLRSSRQKNTWCLVTGAWATGCIKPIVWYDVW